MSSQPVPPKALVRQGLSLLPSPIAASAERANRRIFEFSAPTIRNKNTRVAYYLAVVELFAWCEARRIPLEGADPVVVGVYIEQLGEPYAKPTVKQHLSAIWMLFDWLVTGQVAFCLDCLSA